MKWKFKTLVKFLAMALCSASAWAQVTINPGDILVADPAAFSGHGAVLRIDPTSGAQTVVSQGGSFSRPTALAIEADGRIVTANRVLPGVVRVDPKTGTQTIVASGPPIIDPFGLALEADGSIVISDMGCRFHACSPGEPRVPAAVLRINPVSGAVTTVSAGGYLDSPFALAVEANGGIVVTDATSGVSPLTGQGGIIRINPVTGAQTIVSQGRLDYGCPFGIAVDASGMILNTVLNFGGYGCAPAAIFRANPAVDQNTAFSPHSMGWAGPFGLAVDTDGSVVVAEESYQAIFRVNPNTGFPTQITRFGNLVSPTHVAIARPATANLSVTLTGSAATVNAGDGVTYTYTISVNNSGPLLASGVTLADSWPSGFARGNTTASQGSCTSGGSFTCSLGDLAANSSATVTVNYTVPSTTPGGPQTNTVSVSSNTPDSNTGNKTSSNTVTVNTSSDLSVTKSDGVTTVTAGDGITRTYTITVSNAGPSASSGVTLADTWPSAFTLGNLTASQGSCTPSGGNFTCSVGNLAAGGSATISASYTVPASAPAGTQTNSVSVTSNTSDPNSSNNSASKATTVVISADLSVTKSDGVTSVTAGDGITRTYTITVSNAGPGSAASVTVTDNWPGGFTLGTITTSQGSCTSGGNFTCSLGDMAANTSARITANYTVSSTTPAGVQTNTVSVSSNTPDPNSSNNSASKTTTVNTSADLSVTKSDGVTSVTAGDGITRTYTITVSNAGPSLAASVTLTDSWPGGFTLGAITTSQGSCTSGGNFTCSLGNLVTGGSATIKASYTVPATTPAGSQTNSASVTSNTPDPNSNNNIASKTTTVVTSADLSVTKSDGVTSVGILDSSTHTYTIVVSNAGPSMASGVTLTDTWPSGFTRGTTTTSQGSCTSGSGSFTCSLGNLAPGTSVTVKANYTVPVTSLLTSQTNTVTVSSGTPDPNTANNSASKTTSVGLL